MKPWHVGTHVGAILMALKGKKNILALKIEKSRGEERKVLSLPQKKNLIGQKRIASSPPPPPPVYQMVRP